MALRGRKRRLWLELSRIETERQYLRHQSIALRAVHKGKMEVLWDVVDRDKFYNNVRFRMHSELLWPAYELLYPRDKKTITSEILQITGFDGLVALFSDTGYVNGKRFGLDIGEADPAIFISALKEKGFTPKIHRHHANLRSLYFEGFAGLGFAKYLRKHLHPSVRWRINKFIHKYEPPLPPKKADCTG